VADDLGAVVVKVQDVPADRGDVHDQVDDVHPDRLGRQRAVGQQDAARVQAVPDLDLVERGRPEFPDTGPTGQAEPVEAAVGAGDHEHAAVAGGHPTFGEVRVGGARFRVLRAGGEGRLGSE
jgi:hypothetical protein